jgi:hypothetical protein
MPTINLANLIDTTLVATAPVQGYGSNFKTVTYNFPSGSTIGKIYSYTTDAATGKLYFMIYVTNADYVNFNATYIPIDNTKMQIVELPEIVKQIEAQKALEAQQNEIDKVGLFAYYLNHYLPVIIGVGAGLYLLTHLNRNSNAK